VHAGAAKGRSGESSDPVLEVVGISAVEILARCGRIRNGQRPSGRQLPIRLHSHRAPLVSVAPAHDDGWRLLDFADLSDVDFVWNAHRMLLGRSPSSAEVDRRVGDLHERSSRLGLIVRLGLSPEGRRAQRSGTRGVVLPVLALCAGAIESAASLPVLDRAAAGSERIVRSRLNRSVPGVRRGVVTATAVVVTIALRHHGRRASQRNRRPVRSR
jgi:hypothetical protein